MINITVKFVSGLLLSLLFTLTLSGVSLAATNLASGSSAVVANTDGDGVNLRSKPNPTASIVTVLPEGAKVTITGGSVKTSNLIFYPVKTDSKTGFINAQFLESAPVAAQPVKPAPAPTPPAAKPAPAVPTTAEKYLKVVNTDGDPIRYRAEATTTAEVLGYVYEGNVVKQLSDRIKDASGIDWYKVAHAGTEVGYVMAQFLTATSAPAPTAPSNTTNGATGEKVVAFAKKYLGWEYVWGSEDPANGGFDCSGFVKYIMSQFGVNGTHNAAGWVDKGELVEQANLRPGDIVIWENTYEPGPSHVGIYVGDGKFIHSENQSTGVILTSMSSDYYASRYLVSRRVFP